MQPISFSTRFSWDTQPNPLALLREQLERRGVSVLDLTVSNPTRCGLQWDAGALAACIGAPGSERYDPQPRGLLAAREAVAGEAAVRLRNERLIAPEHIHLTASTSEAYSYLFRLLADPGDDVLVPSPSYPLFEFLAGMEHLRALPYRFRHAPGDGWRLDAASLEAAATERTRAVIAVHPGNPTGAYVRARAMDELHRFCAARGLALICDEVFYDYPLSDAPPPPSSLALEAETLVFTLDGISKSLALPQLKLGWILARGPEPLLTEALGRLDIIADTYLSAGTPVQLALPALLAGGASVRGRIRERCAGNLAALREHCAARRALRCIEPEGGWTALLGIDGAGNEEAFVLRFLGEQHTYAFPGYFFDIAPAGHLVLSLLPSGEDFREGLRRLSAMLGD